MRVVILANGDPPSPELARAAAERHDLLVATDGATIQAAALGLSPGLICGDFDSVHIDAARRAFPNAEIVETPDQDLADLEKAVLLARARGATDITLLGASGGRIDHSLTAIALLLRYHRDVGIALEHDGSTVRAVSGTPDAPGALHVTTRPADTISLVVFSTAQCVSLSGVAWPLENTRIFPGTHGVSNVATGETVTLEVREGVVLVCHLYSGALPHHGPM